jgi:hypothetical protein
MNEEIEYAEMLEIPVSTVNVVHKNGAKKRKTQTVETLAPNERALKESVIAQVNESAQQTEDIVQELNTEETQSMQEAEDGLLADTAMLVESVNGGSIQFDDVPERIDTVRLYSEREREQMRESQMYPDGYAEETDEAFYQNKKEKRLRLVLGAEFAIACALCGGIFLTNVFMPNSAINTFFRALDGASTAQADTRTYADFTLSGVVNDFSNAEISVSPTGIVSFTDACCVYPVADGKVSEVTQNQDGTYTMKIAYSDLFTGVFGGLDYVYYNQGDEVKANVPIGYSEGETEVQMTMYSGGTLLKCFELTEEYCLAWIPQE